MIKWAQDRDTMDKESAIANRVLAIFKREFPGQVNKVTKIDMVMDLDACHNNGCPLDLDALLAAPEFDFIHDTMGIREHINRETGKLEHCFLPRYASRPTVEQLMADFIP